METLKVMKLKVQKRQPLISYLNKRIVWGNMEAEKNNHGANDSTTLTMRHGFS